MIKDLPKKHDFCAHIAPPSQIQELPDLDAAARDFYKEVRALSMDTGGSMADILENIGASSESLSSLIPHEKREELAGFEMSLKQMIDEAKMLADSRPASIAASMEDINMYRRSSDAKTPIQSDFEERRSQSAVSVIDQEAEKE